MVFWAGLAAYIAIAGSTVQVARDFASFWTGAGLSLAGRASDAYGEPARDAMLALFGPAIYPPFFYPPTAFLLWAPFALLSFRIAALLWISGTATAYLVTIRAILGRWPLVSAIAFPAVPVCAIFGQNALLSAALFGGMMVNLERNPIRAGIYLGCLSYKPQLALLAPLALALAGRWRCFAAAAVTAIGLVGVSTVIFGSQAWAGFVGVLPVANAWNADGVPGFDKYVSAYAAVRLLGGTVTAGWTVQGGAAVLAVVLLIVVAWRRPGGAAETAMLVVAAGFTVPFLGEYDMVIFAVPGAWVLAQAHQGGWLPFERAALGALYVSPWFVMFGNWQGVPVAPVPLVILACLVLRRIVQPAAVRPGAAVRTVCVG